MTAQLSREHVEEFISSIESDSALRETRSFELKLAKHMLAGMDSEPVAYMIGGHYLMHAHDPKVDNYASAVPLYTAPPAIPDHMTLIDKGRLLMLERSRQTLLDYRADSVWYWQGDEDDQPDSLSCPVIMSAETLRELLAKSAPPAPVSVPEDFEEWAKDEGLIQKSHGMRFVNSATDIARKAWDAAILKAGPVTAATVPDGWKLVPVEPTKEMIDAGWSYYMTTKSPSSLGVYGAMLAAAPEQEV